MAAIAIIGIILCLVCAFKESSITGTFKEYKVYGRLSAYLALDFTGVGIVSLVSLFVSGFGGADESGITGMASALGLGVVCLALGLLLYIRAYRKCPAHLKKKCIPCMIMSALGVTMKICVFFLPFVWKLNEPSEQPVAEPEPEKEVKAWRWREDGSGIENLKVSRDGERYYDPDDGEWHRIKK